ncbi:dTDP-glucose 4,6-dehydratase [Sesbania bispinosa]|nr:dTDP-glucose 4,6-dehydratase [Sesbania bispinosa]
MEVHPFIGLKIVKVLNVTQTSQYGKGLNHYVQEEFNMDGRCFMFRMLKEKGKRIETYCEGKGSKEFKTRLKQVKVRRTSFLSWLEEEHRSLTVRRNGVIFHVISGSYQKRTIEA